MGALRCFGSGGGLRKTPLPILFLFYTLLACVLLKGIMERDPMEFILEVQESEGRRGSNKGFKWKKGGLWDYEDYLPVGSEPKKVHILMWTEYYHNKDLVDHIKNESPIPDWCTVSFDRNRLHDSQAVVFHATGTDLKMNDLPVRKLWQPWVFYTIEPPVYMARDTEPFKGMFNRTMTYALDSDYPCPYGYLEGRSESVANPYLWDPSFPRASKTKLVAWMVSHCGTESQREKLVENLKKHIKVDIYGSCGTLTCDRSDEEGCYKKLGLEYKFYLSFENSLCKDYITEKFSNALRYNLVPIVYGGGNYSAIVPHPKSFIDASSFPSTKALADYLHYLNDNDTAYAEYFEWQRYYQIQIRQGFAGFRRMCYALQRPQSSHTYDDVGYYIPPVS